MIRWLLVVVALVAGCGGGDAFSAEGPALELDGAAGEGEASLPGAGDASGEVLGDASPDAGGDVSSEAPGDASAEAAPLVDAPAEANPLACPSTEPSTAVIPPAGTCTANASPVCHYASARACVCTSNTTVGAEWLRWACGSSAVVDSRCPVAKPTNGSYPPGPVANYTATPPVCFYGSEVCTWNTNVDPAQTYARARCVAD